MEHIVFELGIALFLIALAGFVSTKLKFSIVPFYILIGMAVGSHAPSFGLIDLRFLESAPLIQFFLGWVPEAIGALLVVLILAETEHMKRIEHMILPFRDFFGAMFFFSFGLQIDPTSLGGAVWLSIAAVIVTLLGNFFAGLIAGRRAGLSAKASTNIGLTIVSRGEFSIIMANLGKSGGLLDILQPFAALYVLILAILGPLLTKESNPAGSASEF